MAQQKFKINMAKQTCNFCKETGHRIHAMDTYGVYLVGTDGERILACPVLLEKEKKKTVVSKKVEDEFPALPGTKVSALSEATVLAAKGIAGAIADQKKAEWEQRKQAKANWEQAKALKNAEAKAARDAETEACMYAKYGVIWNWKVKGTDEDSDLARLRREEDEERDRLEEDAFYYAQKEAEEVELKAQQERWARRALMTPEEARQDEEDEEEELESAMLYAGLENLLSDRRIDMEERRERF